MFNLEEIDPDAGASNFNGHVEVKTSRNGSEV